MVRKYICRLRADLGQRSKALRSFRAVPVGRQQTWDELPQFISGKLVSFLQPAVEQMLALETYDADKEAVPAGTWLNHPLS